MSTAARPAAVAALLGIALVNTGRHAASEQLPTLSAAPEGRRAFVSAGHAAGVDHLRRWDAAVDGLARTRELVVASRLADPSRAGRTHEYLAQHHAGVPVFGGGVSRQLDAGGVTLSLFGTLHQGIDVDAAPALSAAEAAARLEALHGGEAVAGGRPALGVLPLPDGSYALAWRIAMSDGYFYFADAGGGGVLRRVEARMRQSAVGTGADSRGNERKLGTTRAGGRFEAHDRLRPAEAVTLDVRGDDRRFERLQEEHFRNELPRGEPAWTADDYAADGDNAWDDPAVVDAHVHTGWTYDYFAARHGWNGIDGRNGRTVSLVNIGRPGAFFQLPPFGPEGAGMFAYGARSTPAGEDPLTVLDVVAHELTHGVTHYSVSRRTGSPFLDIAPAPADARLGPASFTDTRGRTHTCPTARFPAWVRAPNGRPEVGLAPAWCVDGRFLLAYAGAGAVNEGYSDVFGESVGFHYEDEGASADYLVGGDLQEPIRSMRAPHAFGDPDFYDDRFEFALTRSGPFGWDYSGHVFVHGEYDGSFPDDHFGYGADHWNSLILSHAFYLAVEGGTHSSSGMRVEGVGGDDRADVEDVFFRAMRDLMPATASLPIAAAVIRQAAFDLAEGKAAERAVDQALWAVGLPAWIEAVNAWAPAAPRAAGTRGRPR